MELKLFTRGDEINENFMLVVEVVKKVLNSSFIHATCEQIGWGIT